MRARFLTPLALLVLSLPAAALEIGDKVPTVKAEWIHGQGLDPTTAKDGKKAYMVEFWATWCVPCIQSMPHINELHAKYAKQGLCIMGITDEDAGTATPVMKEQKLAYNVGASGADTKKAFLDGVGARGIPHAFLVTGDGRLAWHGHPAEETLEETLAEILAGTFDIEKTKEINKLWGQVQSSLEQGNLEGVSEKLERLLALKPNRVQFHFVRFQVARHQGKTDRLPALLKMWLDNADGDLRGLTALAKVTLEEDDFSLRQPAIAHAALAKAEALLKAKPVVGGVLNVVTHRLQLGQAAHAAALLDWALAEPRLTAGKAPLAAAKAYVDKLGALK